MAELCLAALVAVLSFHQNLKLESGDKKPRLMSKIGFITCKCSPTAVSFLDVITARFLFGQSLILANGNKNKLMVLRHPSLCCKFYLTDVSSLAIAMGISSFMMGKKFSSPVF